MGRRKPKETLFELGLKLILGGGALLLGPMLVGSSPVFGGFKTVFRFPDWVLLGLGLLVMALHVWRGKRAELTAAPSPQSPKRTTRAKTARATDSPIAGHRSAKTNDRIEPTLAAAAPIVGSPPSTPAHERLTHWSPEVFAAIEWRRFEAVVEALFVQAGFETRAQTHGADGGVDVWLHSRHAGGAPVGVVQCKHWQGKPVPVAAMREFFGVMASHGLKRGTYATTSRFTPEALAFANTNGINAQDGDGLLKLIATRTP